MPQEKDLSRNKYILYARKSTESEDRQVASIQDQISAMKDVAKEYGLEIVETMTEAASGFHAGRQVFNEMIRKIEKGEANGILVWKLSRLSRNPDDAGKLMGMIQRSEIKHIRTSDRNWFPEDNVMMMYVEFGVNNQYSRDLSDDTMRGLMKKAERGWYPSGQLALGYMHFPLKKIGDEEIVCDPERFDLISEGLKKVAYREMTPKQTFKYLHKKGLRSKKGRKVAFSTFYRIMTDPFYYGRFEYPKGSGYWFDGKHIKAIRKEEFEAIQEVLGRNDRPRPKKWFFPYSGMIKCGECGCSILADPKEKHQKNGNVHKYTYYRCTKKKGKCSQKYLEVNKLEEQFSKILSQVKISEDFHQWALEELKKDQQNEINDRTSILSNTRRLYDLAIEKADELVEAWLDKKIPEDIYTKKLKALEKERAKLKDILDNSDKRIDEWIGKAETVLDFALKAQSEFEKGNDYKRKEIITSLGSNLIIKDKKVTLEVQKPLEIISDLNSEIDKIDARLEPVSDVTEKEDRDTSDSIIPAKLRVLDSNQQPID